MSEVDTEQTIWFVYDGDCPICTHAAQMLRIKKEYGELATLNARESENHPLLLEINRRGLDLDEGMVICTGERFYHGKEALKFMSRYGDNRNAFMAFLTGLFWSEWLSRLMYPWMRGVRNALLRRKGVERIDNLNLKQEPIFKSIFGSEWDALPVVIKKHYANRPYTNDVIIVKGELDVMCRPPLLWLAPVMKLLGQIPARNKNQVPTTVCFQSSRDSKAFHFDRVFSFSQGSPYSFHSRMMQVEGHEVMEVMRFRLAWRMRYSWDGSKVVLSHLGYAVLLFGHFIPLPLTMLLGRGYAEEWALDDTSFEMFTHITHPWWGKIYEYKGRFEVMD